MPQQPFEEMAALDRLIHDPARLAIMTALSSAKEGDFLFLQRLTGLTKGNLSSHLAKLEEAQMIVIKKEFVGKVPHTRILPTVQGLDAIAQHWLRLESLRQGALQWKEGNGQNQHQGQEPIVTE